MSGEKELEPTTPKYYAYASMTTFMKEIGEHDLTGVYTMRITPKTITSKNNLTIQQWLKTLEANKNIKKILAFREKEPKEHYHIRFVTSWVTRKSLVDLFKEEFSWPAGKAESNKAYSSHDCKAKDKTLWKAATYIAKEGDCINHYNYCWPTVLKFIDYSKKLRKFKDTPKYKRIIYLYTLHKIDSLPDSGKVNAIYDAIINYHQVKNLEIPEQYRINNLMHNICHHLSAKYRESMKQNIIDRFNFKLHGHWD